MKTREELVEELRKLCVQGQNAAICEDMAACLSIREQTYKLMQELRDIDGSRWDALIAESEQLKRKYQPR